jgi:hypothetical protein
VTQGRLACARVVVHAGRLTSWVEIDYRDPTEAGGQLGDTGSGERRQHRRAGRLVVLAGAVLVASSIGAPATRAAPAQAVADLGFGQSQAALVMIDPRSAELSFGVRFGPTVTDHRNQVARAVAQSTDYGLIGGALTGDSCSGGTPSLRPEDLPQRMRADSRTPGDDVERTVQEGPVTQSVRAAPTPSAQATSRLAELEIPGALRVAGASNRTTSGVDSDGVPVVTGRVDIAELELAGGLVALDGLHWEATSRRGEEPRGAFTIGGATIGGVPIPTQDASDVVAEINSVLSQLGLVLTPPRSHVEEGTLFVDPIRLGIAPNPTRDQIAATTLAAIQPLREQLFGALLAASCDSAALITVVDILLGSFTGGGSLTLNIGGTQTRFGEASAFDGFGPGGDGQSPSAGSPTAGPAPRGAAPAGAAPTGGGTVEPTEDLPGVREAEDDDDTKSDGALAVGIGVLVIGAALAEADRRKMRQAGTAVPRPTPPSPEATAG